MAAGGDARTGRGHRLHREPRGELRSASFRNEPDSTRVRVFFSGTPKMDGFLFGFPLKQRQKGVPSKKQSMAVLFFGTTAGVAALLCTNWGLESPLFEPRPHGCVLIEGIYPFQAGCMFPVFRLVMQCRVENDGPDKLLVSL